MRQSVRLLQPAGLVLLVLGSDWLVSAAVVIALTFVSGGAPARRAGGFRGAQTRLRAQLAWS
jgi:hypothetical protein